MTSRDATKSQPLPSFSASKSNPPRIGSPSRRKTPSVWPPRFKVSKVELENDEKVSRNPLVAAQQMYKSVEDKQAPKDDSMKETDHCADGGDRNVAKYKNKCSKSARDGYNKNAGDPGIKR